jgi:hypothetical protein
MTLSRCAGDESSEKYPYVQSDSLRRGRPGRQHLNMRSLCSLLYFVLLNKPGYQEDIVKKAIESGVDVYSRLYAERIADVVCVIMRKFSSCQT